MTDKKISELIELEGTEKYFLYREIKCEIVRNKDLLHLCGYVLIPTHSKFATSNYQDIPIKVHQGLSLGVILKEYNRIGFACDHIWDFVPYYPTKGGTYRTMQYVEEQLKQMVDQLFELDKNLMVQERRAKNLDKLDD